MIKFVKNSKTEVARKSVVDFLKLITPPIFIKLLRALKPKDISFSGHYDTWTSAKRAARGYEAPEILNKVLLATRKVKSGAAAFERDSYLFDKAQYPYPLLTALLRAASVGRGRLSVVDFGCALGSTYNLCKPLLDGLKEVSWHIVEQPNFVEIGRIEFETPVLKFSNELSMAIENCKPNALLFSGVLQYMENPSVLLQQAVNANVDLIIIDRTPVSNLDLDVIKLQKVSEGISRSSYPVRIFGKNSINKIMLDKYKKIYEFDAVDGIHGTHKNPIHFVGCIFERKKIENN